jgi:hypothetical protein
MIQITETQDGFQAKCGSAVCQLPIVRTTDPISGDELVEAISPTGIKCLFRQAVEVQYVPTKTRAEDGSVTTTYVPHPRLYSGLPELLAKIAIDRFGGALCKISRSKDVESSNEDLSQIMRKAMNGLCNEEWSWDGEASYETWANSQAVILLDSPLPSVPGRFVAEMEANRRMAAAKYLVDQGIISSPCCTGTGDPGKVFYGCNETGYTAVELSNPLIKEASEKRRGVINAVKNAVRIVGEEPSPVKITGLARTPHMTNAVVVCMPINGDDSIVISESLARKLTALHEKSGFFTIDELVNHHGGLRYRGRKGGLVKSDTECPQNKEIIRFADGSREFRPRTPAKGSGAFQPVYDDTALLRGLRGHYEAKYAGMIEKLGAYSSDEMARWKEWLAHSKAWTERNITRPAFRRFESLGVEAVKVDGATVFRERIGLECRPPEVGMKVQSDGDLFKGVVSMILPDDKMPVIRLDGKLRRAEVVAEAGKSLKKHESLRLALGQIALYAVATETGIMEVDPASLTVEDAVELAILTGIYADETLICEVFSSEGTVSLGRFPAGVTRVCRHRQDPSIMARTKGIVANDVAHSESSMKAGGLVNGLPDTYCMLAAGLTECAKELRAKIPAGPTKKLELLRECIA